MPQHHRDVDGEMYSAGSGTSMGDVWMGFYGHLIVIDLFAVIKNGH